MVNEAAQAAANAPMPEIPGYRLEAVLGRGSTGTVYRAIQLAVDRVVALKVLHPELAGSKAVRRLQREARTTARLAHPGIVSAIDMGQVGGLWWYAMELIDGPALSALLREKGRLREREALRLFIPLCEALEHAAEHGVVHRDIKPANILVDAHGRARLVDLGLAFTEDDPLLTRGGGTLGTPHYLSPEQARNPQSVDVRSDIWSLGASMFHAMCGRPPFAGESVAEILSGVLYAHIPDPHELEPSLSPGMCLVLRKCLTRNPDKRYTTPSELLRDLEALRERRSVRVSVRSLDPVAGEKERRRRNIWIAASATTIFAIIGVAWWRPWAASAPTNSITTASEAAWPELDALLSAAQSSEHQAAGVALAHLDEMSEGNNVPPEHSKAYWNARATLQLKFDAAVSEERRRIFQEYQKALTQERDFQRAATLISPEVEEHLVHEFAVTQKQRTAVHAKLDFDELRQQAAADEKEALGRFLERVNAHYETVILPKVRSAQASGAWSDARAWIQRDVREVLDAAGISAFGLSPSKVGDQIASFRLFKVESEVNSIDRAWQVKDAELERAVIADQHVIEDLLQRRALGEDAVAAIEAAYARELAGNSIIALQMLTNVADSSHAALARARVELKKLQEELLIVDARAELESVDAQLANAWKDRQYAEIAAVWETRLSEEWLRPVHAEVELRRSEAVLLEGLLERAAKGLKAPGLDSILVGSFPHTGRIDAGEDPLKDGFQLVIAGKAEPYALRAPTSGTGAALLRSGGVERLAGLASDPKDEAQSIDRLVRALFRMREGEPDMALKAFKSGELPRETHGPLIMDLETRLLQAHGVLSAKVQQHELDAQEAYNLIQRSSKSEVKDRIKRINDLLVQYGDTSFVREHETELRELKTQLDLSSRVSSEARLQAIYGGEISFPGNARALLVYECALEEIPPWSMGDWKRGADGWSAERKHSRGELEDEQLWPRLTLGEPLDANAPMSVELEFEQPKASGPPQRFIVSVAGVHIGFAGPADTGLKSQFAARAGGVEALKEVLELLDKQRGTTIKGLDRGSHYVLRIELLQNRGRLTASLNGEPLPGQDYLRPEAKAGSYSIIVRSMEPVLLKAVRIDALVRK